MLTGFEALGAASAVLQVISLASDLVFACKNAYDEATISSDDLQRHVRRMLDAVDRAHTRCGQMTNSNVCFSAPELQNIAHKCNDTANKLETEVGYVTRLQAKGDIVKSIRKALRAYSHQKKLESIENSLSEYKKLIEIELAMHLSSRSDAIVIQQELGFQDLDVDTRLLVNQIAEAVELTTTAETKRRCETFLQSLKTPRMNQRYNDVLNSMNASFNQVFASYEQMRANYYENSEDSDELEDDADPDNEGGSDGSISSKTTRDLGYKGHMDHISRSWASFNSWLQSNDPLFYIQGKPGSGKSTLVKFIVNQDQTRDLVHRWNPDVTIISYFFWKIGSHEQNSIKGLWCSLLYQRLQDQQHVILDILQQFNYLSLHSEYHDWSVRDLEAVWHHIDNLDTQHMCIFIDGLDEIRNEDGFSRLLQSIQSISRSPKTKLCVTTRPEVQILQWLKTTNAGGILLEDLTRLDMLIFVQNTFNGLILRSRISSEALSRLSKELVEKAQGVFLWLHLATRSIVQGIENGDSEDILFDLLHEHPGDLESLYLGIWQRMNLRNNIYQETAARYFRYALRRSDLAYATSQQWTAVHLPTTFQIACAESEHISKALLSGSRILEVEEIREICNQTEVSIRTRCAGLLEIRPQGDNQSISYLLGNNEDAVDEALGKVVFIHRSAYDFLADTEEGQRILGRAPLSDFALHTRLLKGLISMVVVSHVNWNLVVHARIIHDITCFAERWGSEGLQVAMEMLDIVRPLYEKRSMRHYIYPWMPHRPFFINIVGNGAFERYIISRLRSESSTSVATRVLREGWDPDYDTSWLSKGLTDALLSKGADAHEYGETSRTEDMIPFVRKGTAFTNLLTSLVNTTQRSLYKYDGQCFVQDGATNIPFQMLETLIRMAMTCQDLNAAVLMLSSFTDCGAMVTMALTELAGNLAESKFGGSHFVVFEVNIQFLILYLISKLSGDVAEALLGGLGAHDLISKLDGPSVKTRYFLTAESTDDWMGSDEAYRLTCQRIPLDSAVLPGRVINRLFGVRLKGCSTNPSTSNEGQTDLKIICQLVDESNTDEVEFEAAISSLAKESLGFCTYQDAGKIPTVDYLRGPECQEKRYLFPLTMGKLEAAASDHV